MSDAPTPADRRSEGISVLAELTAINGEVDGGARELESLVKLDDMPNAALLSAARLRFSRALRRHLRHVDGVVMPYLRATFDAKTDQIVGDYRRVLNGYHEAAAHHVALWPSNNVAADWGGYRRSVADMLARLRKRVEIEQRDILPLLASAVHDADPIRRPLSQSD